jgi:iron complex transport system substrate-binding protein
MFRKTFCVVFLGMLAIAACAPVSLSNKTDHSRAFCSPAVPLYEAKSPTFIDGLGREVKLESPAQRVVSLAPSNTEILFALGAGDKVVGRDEFSDYPEAAKVIQSVGGSMGEYSLESIVALKPDLVLASELNSPELVASLEKLGLVVYYLPNPKSFNDLYNNLQIVADLTGRDSAKLTDTLNAQLVSLDEKIAPLSYRPAVFYEIDATDPSKPYTAGVDTFINLLITCAGGINFTELAGIKDAYPQVSLEQLVVMPPDFIILGDSMWGTTPESVAGRPGWDVLKAVIEGHVFPFDDNLVSRPGPRLVDGLEALAKLLHPEVFK